MGDGSNGMSYDMLACQHCRAGFLGRRAAAQILGLAPSMDGETLRALPPDLPPENSSRQNWSSLVM